VRIAALDLLAFGPFTRTRLSFGTEAGKLALIYGPNEAGKSTLLRALSALLFQIPSRTVDAHVHEMSKLRLGGTLIAADGRTLSVVRRKGVKQTLLDRQEQPVDESALTTLLGGVNESLFRQMFALDHERLREGAELLLEGKGDVGESLFEAGLNARSLHKAQLALRAEADEIYKQRGQTPKLNACLRTLRDNERRRKDAMLSPQVFESERQALREAEAAQESTLEKRRVLMLERERLERSLRTLPLLAQLGRAVERLAEIGDVIEVSEAELARFERITNELAEARAESQRIGAQLFAIDHELSAVANVPEHMLEEEELSELSERFGSYRQALRELPVRRAERDALGRDTQALRAQLGLGDTPRGLIDTPTRARLLALVEAERTTAEEVSRAEIAERQARAILAAQQAQQAALGPWRSSKALAQSCAEAQAERSAAALGELERSIAQRTAHVRRLRDELDLASDLTSEHLLEVALPSRNEVAALASDDEQAKQRLADARRELARAEGELKELEQGLRRSEALGELLGEDQLSEARADRDRLWHGLSDALQHAGASVASESIRAFDVALRRSDSLSDRLRHESAHAAERALLGARRRELELECQQHATATAIAEAQIEAVAAAGRALCQKLHLQPRAAKLLERAFERFLALLEEIRALAEARAEYDARLTRERTLATRIRQALADLSISAPAEATLADLLARGLDHVALLEREAREHERLVREHNASRDRLHEAGAVCDALRTKLEHIQTQLANASSELGFSRAVSGVELRALLDGLSELDARLHQQHAVEGRVVQLESDVQTFEHDVAVGVAHIGLEAQGTPEEQLRRLRDSQREARDARRDRERLLAQKRSLSARRDVAEQIVSTRTQTATEILTLAGAADEAAFRALSSRARTRSELVQERARLERELLLQSDGHSLSALKEQASALDVDGARARLVEIAEAAEELEEELRQREQHIGRSRAGVELLEHTSGARELSEDVEADLSSARALLRRYVEVRLAAQLLSREVERYRSEHQGPVLARASQLFPRLTLERYRGLDVDYDDDRPVLCAVRHDRVRVQVAGLSDGTRDQLYLALRIASIERFLEHSAAPPLVLDDAFVHFDDERTRAALEVLTELAQRTQVLYFTHHARVVELARSTLEPNRLQVQTLANASGTRLVVRDDGPLFSR
jgi:uncharacterized protein YhaN